MRQLQLVSPSCARSLGRGSIQVNLPLIEKKRQSKGYANQAHRRNRQPPSRQTEPSPLDQHKTADHERGDQHVEPEKSAHSIHEQIMEEETDAEPMRRNPRQEGGVGENQTQHAQS